MTPMERLMLAAGAVERAAFRLKLWAHTGTLPWVDCDDCDGTGLGRFPLLVCPNCDGVGGYRDRSEFPPPAPVGSEGWRGWGCVLCIASWMAAAVGFWFYYSRGPGAVLASLKALGCLVGAGCSGWCAFDDLRRFVSGRGPTAPLAVQVISLAAVLFIAVFLVAVSI